MSATKKKVNKASSGLTDLFNKLLIASIVIGAVGLITYEIFFAPDTFTLDKHKYPIFGIDISKHNGKIDWDELQKQNIDFVFMKATEGRTLVDPWFKVNIAGAKKEKIKVGAYHFFKFNRDGAEQARNFLAQIRLIKLDFPPILDVEEYTNMRSRKNLRDVITQIRKFIAVVESSTGRKVLIYMNENDYERYIKDNFNRNPLWICSLDEEPKIDRAWKFWQYSHRGKLKGIRGLFDFNTFNGDRQDWNNFINANAK
jgi:lysozyme